MARAYHPLLVALILASAGRAAAESAVQVSLGERHACARLVSGGVACWGEVAEGSPLVVATPVEGLTDVVDVAAGDAGQTCALTGKEKVTCFGGPVGKKRPVAGLRRPIVLAAGPGRMCAIDEDGGVACWGADGKARPLAGLPPVKSLALDRELSCAQARSDEVWCWDQDAPVRLATLGRPRALVVGRGSVCTLGEAGEVTCHGKNAPFHGPLDAEVVELAVGEELACTRSTTGAVRCGGDTRVDDASALVARGGTACALRRSGRVACWGEPGPWPRKIDGISGARALAVGRALSCAESASGEARCWGAFGAQHVDRLDSARSLAVGGETVCGLGGNVSLLCAGFNPSGRPEYDYIPGAASARAVAVDAESGVWIINHDGGVAFAAAKGRLGGWTPVDGMQGAVQLAAGCALLGDGRVACTPTVKVPEVRGARALSGSPDGYCALLADGAVCWDGKGASWRIPGFAGAEAIAVGRGHACALRAGEVWCAGENGWGQLGDGSLTARAQPVEVALPVMAVALAAGREHTCAVDWQGYVWCWGRNDKGQVARGTQPRDVEGL